MKIRMSCIKITGYVFYYVLFKTQKGVLGDLVLLISP